MLLKFMSGEILYVLQISIGNTLTVSKQRNFYTQTTIDLKFEWVAHVVNNELLSYLWSLIGLLVNEHLPLLL